MVERTVGGCQAVQAAAKLRFHAQPGRNRVIARAAFKLRSVSSCQSVGTTTVVGVMAVFINNAEQVI